MFSPLICGTIAVKYGFNYGFASAGIGMLIGVLTYKLNEHLLGDAGKNPVQPIFNKKPKPKTKLTKREVNQIYSLFTLMAFTIVFWTCYEQAGCSLTLFAEYETQREFFGHTIPTGYFQALNPFFIIVLAPIVSILWTKLSERKLEPTSVEKFTLALGLMSFAYVIMAMAGNLSTGGIVSPLWLVSAYFIMTVAELCISPIGLSLVSKLAPKQCISVLMGTWFLTSFFGNIFAGMWGGRYGTISTETLFLTLAVISLVSAIGLACLIPKIKKYLGRF